MPTTKALIHPSISTSNTPNKVTLSRPHPKLHISNNTLSTRHRFSLSNNLLALLSNNTNNNTLNHLNNTLLLNNRILSHLPSISNHTLSLLPLSL